MWSARANTAKTSASKKQSLVVSYRIMNIPRLSTSSAQLHEYLRSVRLRGFPQCVIFFAVGKFVGGLVVTSVLCELAILAAPVALGAVGFGTVAFRDPSSSYV